MWGIIILKNMNKSIEELFLDKILYIGNKIPSSLFNDERDKFILLGTPQELLDKIEEKLGNLLKEYRKSIVETLNEYPARCQKCGKPSETLKLGDALNANALGGSCFECVSKIPTSNN